MLTLRNSTRSVGTGMVELLCGDRDAGAGVAGGGTRNGGWPCASRGSGGLEELEQLVGDLPGGLQRGPVPDVGEDLDGGVAVRVGEFLAGRGRTDGVVGAGDQQQRQAGLDRSGIGGA